jgi:hypothetical protein
MHKKELNCTRIEINGIKKPPAAITGGCKI